MRKKSSMHVGWKKLGSRRFQDTFSAEDIKDAADKENLWH